MRNILQLVINLWYWLHFLYLSFFGILWYGKLPKVSLYHWAVNGCLFTTKGIYNDVNHQVFNVKCVPSRVKEQIIEDYIDELYKNKMFQGNIQSLVIPLFDGKDIYGTQSVIQIFSDVKHSYLKSVS